MVLGFLRGGFDDGVDTHESGIEAFDDTFDGAAFACGIGALQDNDDGMSFLAEAELEVQELELVLFKLPFIIFLIEGFRLVEFVKADALFGH
jgi:hypothetical protein